MKNFGTIPVGGGVGVRNSDDNANSVQLPTGTELGNIINTSLGVMCHTQVFLTKYSD